MAINTEGIKRPAGGIDEKTAVAPTHEEKAQMPPWMSKDADGKYHYIVFKAGENYYALDDDYMDVYVGVSKYLRDTKVDDTVFGSFIDTRGIIRVVIGLPKKLGYDEKPAGESIILHIAPDKMGGDACSLLINSFPDPMSFYETEIADPRDVGNYSFPNYIPRVITDPKLGPIQVIDLEALLTGKSRWVSERRSDSHDDSEGKF